MAQFNGMADNPGDPDNTDPEATSADRAEEAAAEAADAQSAEDADAAAKADAEADAAEEAVLDPTLEAEVDEALVDVEGDVDPEADAVGTTLEAQLAERTEDLQRLNAEYTNYRRRTERERQSVIDNAKAQVIAQLLPIVDDLELARQHGDLEEGPLKALADKFNSVLQEQKLISFGAEGDAFDPELHEAVQDLSSGDEKVLGTVLRRGYRIGDRLVRNAMVIIADPSESSADSNGSADDAEDSVDSRGSEQG